jgi:spore germination protein YaaH
MTLPAMRPRCRRTGPWVLAIGLALGLGAPAAPADATSSVAAPAAMANPSPSPSPLQAFLLTSAPDSFADLQAHAGEIGVVYPTYFECSPGGEVVGIANAEVDSYAAAQGLVEMPRFSCQNGTLVHRILTQPALRARVFARLVGIADDLSYAGINLDLENDGARDRRALTAFVVALAARLQAEGRKLAVDVVGVTGETVPRPAAGFYDDRALAAVADTVFVMAWGPHWEGSGPGPIAPLSFVRDVARYVASLPHAQRFVLGVPMYGLDWSIGGEPRHNATALQYAALLGLAQSAGATPVRDPASGELTFTYMRAGVLHRVWFMDARAIAERVRIAGDFGLAAGVWRLGEEDQAVWSSIGV